MPIAGERHKGENPVEPEMMIAEVRLKGAPVQGIEPTVQPLVRKKRLAVSALVLGIVSVLLLILVYLAVVLTVARFVPVAAATG